MVIDDRLQGEDNITTDLIELIIDANTVTVGELKVIMDQVPKLRKLKILNVHNRCIIDYVGCHFPQLEYFTYSQ